MKRTLAFAWVVLTIIAALSLFAPGDASIVFGGILIFASLPLSFVVELVFGCFLKALLFFGWSGTGYWPWFILNLGNLLLVGLVGFFQWFVLLPWIGMRLRRRQG